MMDKEQLYLYLEYFEVAAAFSPLHLFFSFFLPIHETSIEPETQENL